MTAKHCEPAPEAEDMLKIPKMSDTELLDWVIGELQAEKNEMLGISNPLPLLHDMKKMSDTQITKLYGGKARLAESGYGPEFARGYLHRERQLCSNWHGTLRMILNVIDEARIKP